MGSVIVVCNQKGGVGKTTTAAALAAGLAIHGFHVLAVDTDPQHNLSSISGAYTGGYTLSDVIAGRQTAPDAIRPTAQGYDLLPGDLELSTLPEGYQLDTLKEILNAILDEYDYVVIDTPPALSLLTMSALVTASYIVIPTHADVFSLYGLDQVADTIDAIRPYNDALEGVGVLLTRYSGRRNIDRTMRGAINARAQQMGATLYGATIRAGVAVPESQLLKEDIFTSAPRSGVTEDYNSFIDEFLCYERGKLWLNEEQLYKEQQKKRLPE